MSSFFKNTWLFCFFVFVTAHLEAQVIDPTTSFKTIHSNRYVRLYYDNDFFTKSDYYYTQGITIECVDPSFKKIPVVKILAQLRGSAIQYGVSANIFGYTPTNYESNEILYGDRPFAAAMSLAFFSVASDNVRQQRLSSAVSVGIIGPAAQGEQIQTGIHRWLHNVLPRGWQYQLRNDVIANYKVNYERKLFAAGDGFVLNGIAVASAGTLTDNLSTGINLMAGQFNNRYRAIASKKKIEFYFYGQSWVRAIGYDASLEGGLFNRSSPYSVAASNISRVVLQADAGIVLDFKTVCLCYSQSFITKEFNTGRCHRWGGISVGFSIK